MTENEISFICILIFSFALFLGYFLGWIDGQKKLKKPKTTTITIALNSSIRAGDTIKEGKETYEVRQAGHFFGGEAPCTTLLVEKINRDK
jgi:hypothetical protein